MEKLVKKNTERTVVEAYFHAFSDCCNASGGGSTVGGAGSGNSGNTIGSGNGSNNGGK